MDEKQIRETFEAKYGRRPVDSPWSSELWDTRFSAWLACYQHLAPMVEDAERYRFLRANVTNGQEFGYALTWCDGSYHPVDDPDTPIDAAREQEKKNAQE